MATYFLDFDRTLFDTSAFLEYLIARDGLDILRAKTEPEMAVLLNDMTEEGSVHFFKGELAQFLFPDAETFLSAHAAESVVVTAGNEALQRAKCENVFAAFPTLKIFYTGDERKGPYIARIENDFLKPWIFIDDKPMELESVQTAHPETALFQMCRKGLQPAGTFPALYSFADLARAPLDTAA